MREQLSIRSDRPATSLAGWLIVCCLWWMATTGQTASFVVTLTETTDPPELTSFQAKLAVFDPNHPDAFTITNTDTAPTPIGTYQFTHWTLRGERVQDFTGEAVNPAEVILTSNITAVAHYVSNNQYTADQIVPDWYKIHYFGRTNITASDNPSGDGFNIGVDYLRGYDPLLFNQIIEGGISRRRSASTLVIIDTNLAQVAAKSDPLGLYPAALQVLARGANYSLGATPSYTGYGFIGWFVGSNRVDDPHGFSYGTLNFTITSNTTFVARFLPDTQDSDNDGLPDWYEMYYLGSLTNTPASNPSGDGFDIATDILRGYQPNVFNGIVEGGISRRRSSTTLILVDTNLIRVTATSVLFGLYGDFQIKVRGTDFGLPLPPQLSYSGYGFIGWFVGSNRIDDPKGFSAGTLNVTVSNDTTFVAQFLPESQDSDSDGLPDWYELYYFGSLTNTPASSPRGDGFDIATDMLRGYQPNVFNEIIEGGISRRRSASFQFIPAPPGIGVQPHDQGSPQGTNVTLSVTPQGIPPFNFQWRLNGVNLAGATNATLTISNAHPTDGGTYSVVVGNPFGFTVSDGGVLLIDSQQLVFKDNIADTIPVTSSFSAVGSGDNVNATHEVGETNHAGKFGSNSVWLAWQSPANGIATFTARGSSFDTVLAVYVLHSPGGPVSVTNLDLITSDDDRGGYLTSLVQFNAVAGGTYFVAVDGFVRSSGNIVLSWALQVTNSELPVIIHQPVSQTVALGSAATFSVAATSSLPLSYQWLVDGSIIPGATKTNLVLPGVQVVDVGNYQVEISNGAGEVVSDVAFLQINITGPDGHAQQVAALEKLADAPLGNLPLVANSHVQHATPALGDEGAIGFSSPPARGLSGTQIYSTKSNSTASAVAWFKLKADSDGPLLVTTEGSEFDTYFTVSSGVSNAVSTAQLSDVGIAYNGGTDYRTRRITFTAQSNVVYYIRLDGVSHYGKVWLSWVLGYQQAIQRPVGPQFGHTRFSAAPTDTAPSSLQWFFNDALLPGQTNLDLTLASVLTSSEGAYSIQVSNATGQVTRDKVYLHVLPILLSLSRPATNTEPASLRIGSSYGLPVVVQSSVDLLHWTTIYTNGTPATNSANLIGSQTISNQQRFYRFQFP